MADGSPPVAFAEHAARVPRRRASPARRSPTRVARTARSDGVTTGVRAASLRDGRDRRRRRPLPARAAPRDRRAPAGPRTSWSRRTRSTSARPAVARAMGHGEDAAESRLGHDYPGHARDPSVDVPADRGLRRGRAVREPRADPDGAGARRRRARRPRTCIVARRPPSTRALPRGSESARPTTTSRSPSRLAAHLALLPATVGPRARAGAGTTLAAAARRRRRARRDRTSPPRGPRALPSLGVVVRTRLARGARGLRLARRGGTPCASAGAGTAGVTLRRAATPMRVLRRRARASARADGGTRQRGGVRAVAERLASAIGRTGRARRPRGGPRARAVLVHEPDGAAHQVGTVAIGGDRRGALVHGHAATRRCRGKRPGSPGEAGRPPGP